MLLVQHASVPEVVNQGIVLLGHAVGRLRLGRAGTRMGVWEERALGDAGVVGVGVVDVPVLGAVVVVVVAVAGAVVEVGVRASLAQNC